MDKVTSETDLLVLKSMKKALIERYRSNQGQSPVIQYSESKNSKGEEGYTLSIQSYSGMPEQLKPVPSQELIRVLRRGFKAMGCDTMQFSLERCDDGGRSGVFVSHSLLQSILLGVAFAGHSGALDSFKNAVVNATKAQR